MTPASSPTLPEIRPENCDTAVLPALPRVSFRDRRHAVPADRPAPGRYLALEDGDERALLPVRPGTTHVGRGFAADLQRHAILHVRPGGVRILDDRSANGTFVNGRRVLEATLADGDVVVLGRVVLVYRDVP
jgi:hypothetical protein